MCSKRRVIIKAIVPYIIFYNLIKINCELQFYKSNLILVRYFIILQSHEIIKLNLNQAYNNYVDCTVNITIINQKQQFFKWWDIDCTKSKMVMKSLHDGYFKTIS